jgi:hypothetical protein
VVSIALTVPTGHSLLRLRFRSVGRSAHGSSPSAGVDQGQQKGDEQEAVSRHGSRVS